MGGGGGRNLGSALLSSPSSSAHRHVGNTLFMCFSACGQIVLLGARGTRRASSPATRCPYPFGAHFPSAWGRCRHWGLPGGGAGAVLTRAGAPSAVSPIWPTYDRRERAISTLVTPLVLHGVAVTSVTDSNLRGWRPRPYGPCRVPRACPGPRRSSSRS